MKMIEDWHRGLVLDRHGKTDFFKLDITRSPTSFFLGTNTVIFCSINLKFYLLRLKVLLLLATIKHQYTDDKTKEDIWWDAEVVDVDSESPDINNPNFHILYKDSSEDMIDFSQISDSDYFLEPLINN